MIRLLINGFCGQMGRTLLNAVHARSDDFCVAAGVDAFFEGVSDGIPVVKTPDEVSVPVDVVIDFSVPAALPAVLRFAQTRGIPAVIGTTGLTERDRVLLESAAERIPVFQTGNMSLGVNLQLELVKRAEATLGSAFDVEIIEKHHNRKIDAPSGTALMLGDAIASQHTGELEYVFGRSEKNKRRSKNEIGFHSIRGGTLSGEHEVMFIGQDEVVEVTHRAYSKHVFAVGALRAAEYVLQKPAGLYSMQNIMTEQNVASHLYSLEDQAVITISGLSSAFSVNRRIFACMAENGVFIDMIACTMPAGSAASLGISLAGSQLSDALNALKAFTKQYPDVDIHVKSNVTKLTIEGPGMALRHGIAAELFSVLSDADVQIELITTSETKIELCVNSKDAPNAISALRKGFLHAD